MLKLSWTNENVSFVEWHHELKKHFSIFEWEKLPSETDPFFFMFMEGKTVSQALMEGKLILKNALLNTKVETIIQNRITNPIPNLADITAVLNFPVTGETEITLHKIIKTVHLWEATINATGKIILVTDDHFSL
jgi:hypothetical protein